MNPFVSQVLLDWESDSNFTKVSCVKYKDIKSGNVKKSRGNFNYCYVAEDIGPIYIGHSAKSNYRIFAHIDGEEKNELLNSALTSYEDIMWVVYAKYLQDREEYYVNAYETYIYGANKTKDGKPIKELTYEKRLELWGSGAPIGFIHAGHSQESSEKAKATIIKRFGGLMGQCHTPEVMARSLETRKVTGKLDHWIKSAKRPDVLNKMRESGAMQRFIDAGISAAHTKEANDKRVSTSISWYGNPMGRANSEEVIQSKFGTPIYDIVTYLLSNGLSITEDNWNEGRKSVWSKYSARKILKWDKALCYPGCIAEAIYDFVGLTYQDAISLHSYLDERIKVSLECRYGRK